MFILCEVYSQKALSNMHHSAEAGRYVLTVELPRISVDESSKQTITVVMSHPQFHSKIFTLRHAWLNLRDKHMTTGRINQVTVPFIKG